MKNDSRRTLIFSQLITYFKHIEVTKIKYLIYEHVELIRTCHVKHLIITGMGRSGTTLLGKLLTSHKDIDLLSQPLPMLFVEVKRQFLRSKGIDEYYALNDDFISRNYKARDLNNFLKNVSISHTGIETIFHNMREYSRQGTKGDFDHICDAGIQLGFKNILEKGLDFYRLDSDIPYIGSKEIMCEEFLSYLCEMNYKCIVIIRDPRDVLASANYPKGKKYFGEKRPSLFVLRSWRKSVEYTYLLRKNKNFRFLRYEDLVYQPYLELNKITTFLGVDDFPSDCFDKGIFERNGKAWQANSSFGNEGSFISQKSKDIFKEKLTTEEIKYAEAICKYELNWLNYPLEFGVSPIESIRDFRDTEIENNDHIPVNYSSQAENISKEIERAKSFSRFYLQS